MAAPNPLTAIPPGQSFPLHLAPGLNPAKEGSLSKKRKAGPVFGLRYNFKPASITTDIPGALHGSNGSRTLNFDLPGGGKQVFDAREEAGKTRECVMIWDEAKQVFTLHPLASTLHLTLNRSASSTGAHAPITQPAPVWSGTRTDSIASSGSGATIPLADTSVGRKRPRPMPDGEPASDPESEPERPLHSGKSVPRKQPVLPAAAHPTLGGKGRGKAGARKKLPPTPKGKVSKPKAETPKGKIKSAEIIEDSDEEAAAYDDAMQQHDGEDDAEGEVEDEDDGGIDEFAMLLDQSLAEGDDVQEAPQLLQPAEDEDDDSSEYEDDDDEF